jgi:hypothetical protein
MPFILSPATLTLQFRQNNAPTPSGDYQPSRWFSMAGSLCLLGTSQMTATFQFSDVGLAKPSSQVAFLSNQLKSPDN